MENELMIGLELLFIGLAVVFAVLLLLKFIMDLMTAVVNKPTVTDPQQGAKSYDDSEEELAAIMAVMAKVLPERKEATVRLKVREVKN